MYKKGLKGFFIAGMLQQFVRLQRFRLHSRCSSSKSELTAEQKAKLRSALPAFSVGQDVKKEDAWTSSMDIIDDDKAAFDEIRARG
uniref:Uncharacterized protein n=1 Tax=Bursaphelenchus xylophilus TaxID=6326 RepID=A0A1I7SWF3_BURXY